MKKIVLALVLGISAVTAKINCVTSILPEKIFVEAIGGDKVHTMVMVPPGNEPHTYEPKPSQMKEIAKAQLFLALGVPFENAWLPKLKNQNSKMEVINVGKGVEKIAMAEHHHEGEHKEEKHKKEHHHGGLDPHIWTSPKNIKIIAKNIYTALVAKDKVNSDYYKSNYEKFLAKIDATDKEIKKILGTLPKGTKFMVFHPAWGYFAKEYGLEQIAIEAGGKEPKPKQLMHLVDEAKEEKVTAIFTEPEFSQKAAKVIAKEAGVPVVAVSPLNPDWSQNLIGLAKAIAKK